MKKISFYLLCIILIGCKSKSSQLSQVALHPSIGISFIQVPFDTDSAIVFYWKYPNIQSDRNVRFQIHFDTTDNVKSPPCFTMESDQSGFDTSLHLNSGLLTKIAVKCNINPTHKSSIFWTVYAIDSDGKIIQYTNPKEFTLLRAKGLKQFPDSLYLSGIATEAGDNLESAIPFIRIEKGVFELYTSLKFGKPYRIIDKANHLAYIINPNDKSIYTNNGNSISGIKTSSCRIIMDFNQGIGKISSIVSLRLYQSDFNSFIYAKPANASNFNYIGNGQWEQKNEKVVFLRDIWGYDGRYYKFLITFFDSNKVSEEWLGSYNVGNSNPHPEEYQTYWKLYPLVNTINTKNNGNKRNQNHCFRFPGSADTAPGDPTGDVAAKTDIKVTLSSTYPYYTHEIKVHK